MFQKSKKQSEAFECFARISQQSDDIFSTTAPVQFGMFFFVQAQSS